MSFGLREFDAGSNAVDPQDWVSERGGTTFDERFFFPSFGDGPTDTSTAPREIRNAFHEQIEEVLSIAADDGSWLRVRAGGTFVDRLAVQTCPEARPDAG